MKDTGNKNFIVKVDDDGKITFPQEVIKNKQINPGEKFKLSIAETYFILSRIEAEKKDEYEFSEKDIEIRESIGAFYELMVSAVHLSAEENSRIQFKGDMATVGIADILMFLNAAKKTGVLFLDLIRYKKVFFMVSGEIFIAISNKPEENLLEILKRKKKISRKLADNIQKQANEENKDINTVILECKDIDTNVLLQMVRYQLEECIYDLFMENAGKFSFIDEEYPPNTEIFIPMSLTNLVMEGARRVDEWSRIRKDIDSMDIVFELTADKKEIKLEPDEFIVMDLIDGRRTVSDIVEESGIDKFEVAHILYRLLSTNSIMKKDQDKLESLDLPSKKRTQTIKKKEDITVKGPDEIGEADLMEYNDIINQYNVIFSTIFESVKFAIGEGARVVLATFFKGLEQDQIFADINSIEEDGTIDPAKIILNLKNVPQDQRRQILTDSLNELLYSQLFAVKNTIGTEMEQAILNIIKTQLKR